MHNLFQVKYSDTLLLVECQGRDPKICLLQNEAVGGAVEQDHGEGGVQLQLDEWAQSIGASRLQVERY